MTNTKVEKIIGKLESFLRKDDSSPFNYERYLLLEKAKYLDAFVEGKPFPPFEIEIQMSSKCNLQCRWCIGREVQSRRRVLHLPNNIDVENVDNIVNGIIEFQVNHLRVQAVKFSGFIGEPLIPTAKKATLKAIKELKRAGLQVGLFTNGVFMEEDSWQTLVNIDYVHISLDAGPDTFTLLKESPKVSYSNTFNKILSNITGLNQIRDKSKDKSNLKINIGFVITPNNYHEIYETTRLIKSIGADSIRFKCDIGNKYDLQKTEILYKVFNEINKTQREFNFPPYFTVHIIHTKEDIENKKTDFVGNYS